MVVDILYGDVLRNDGKYFSSDELKRIKKLFDNRYANLGCYNRNRTDYITSFSQITHVVNKVFIENNILKADIKMINSELLESETFMFVDKYFPEINIIDKKDEPYKQHKLDLIRKKKLTKII